MEPTKFVQVKDFGADEIFQPDIVILTRHGDDGKEFLENFPEVVGTCGADRDTLERYLRLESDFGTQELAHDTAQAVAETSKGRRLITRVMDVRFPLGILDTNMMDVREALRNLFEPEVFEEILEIIEDIHAQIIECIQREVTGNTGVFLDLHSMSPFQRRSGMQETPGHLDEYIASFETAKNRGAKRAVDLVTSLKEGNRGPHLAHRDLSIGVESALQRRGIPLAWNKPFRIKPGTLLENLLRSHRGLSVDIPKDLLASGEAEDVAANLSDLRLDHNKVSRLAQCFAEALLRCF